MDKILTIIVPSYNMEAYLPKCLGSLIIDDKTLFQKLDVIVVNDGSKDRTSEIAHEFEAKYPGVFRVIDKPNGHYGSCVNAALKVAKGQYVKMLDADDSYDTNNFHKFLHFLLDEALLKNIDFIMMDMTITDAMGNNTPVQSYSIGNGVYSLDDFPDRIFHAMSIHCAAIKTCIFRQLNYHQTEGIPYTDLEWVFIPLSRVKRIMCFPYPVVRYLRGREGQSFSPENQRRDCMKRVQVIMRHIKDYKREEANFEPTARRYMRGRLLNRLELAYQTMFETRNSFALLDDLLKETLPEFYALTDAFSYSSLRFKYVRAWRKTRSFNSLKFRLFFLTKRIISIFRGGKK